MMDNQRFELLAPTIDPRDHEYLLEQLNSIVSFYAPEWSFNKDNPDFGSALALIFLRLLEGNIERLNKLPYKSLVTFLNHFNVERAPATSAVANVQFKLAQGTPQPVWIEKGVQLAANVAGGEAVVFETESTALLTTSHLEQVIAVYPRNDRIVVHKEDDSWLVDDQNNELDQAAAIALYGSKGTNVQEHTLYIEHPFLLQVEHPCSIELHFSHAQHEVAAKEAALLLADESKVSWEYFSEGQWVAFDAVHGYEQRLRLLKLRTKPVSKSIVAEQEGYWIRCRAHSLSADDNNLALGKVQFQRLTMKTDYAAAHKNSGIMAERAFYNDLPIGTVKGCEPFGDFFATYGCFYIGNKEVLGKRGADITIAFQLSYNMHRLFPDKPKQINWKPIMKREVVDRVDIPDPVTITKVQWEYWNGRSWAVLPVAEEMSTLFQEAWDDARNIQLTFTVPEDLEGIEVNAEYSMWIRARIVTVANPYSIDAIYYSPYVEDMKLTYHYKDRTLNPQKCWSYNNLDWRDYTSQLHSGGMIVRPFQPLAGYQPAVWFGFDLPPERGPIHLYIDIISRNWTTDEIPHVEWQYLKALGGSVQWQPLVVADETQGFSRSGIIQFVGPRDFAYHNQFGKSQYWIRAVNHDTRFYVNNEPDYEPLVKSMQLNTLRVLQQHTIHHENPIYIDGYDLTQDQQANYYALSLKPVISEMVWVDETGRISSNELDEFIADAPELLDLQRDSEGQLMQVWVRYKRVDHFLHSTPTDRHYCIERATGRITFGNGQAGRALSINGVDQVRVSYINGGGEKGNVEKGTITSLQNAIAFVESVSNVEAAAGGCDSGSVGDAILQGTKYFAHRGRAVIAEDFESLTRSIHPNVAKVRCLPNQNIKLQPEAGALTIVVMPHTGRGQNTHFLELKKWIEVKLLSITAASIAIPNQLQVIEPVYVEIGVRATIWVRNMDEVVVVEKQLQQKLKQFLDPIHGNHDGRGWKIGQSIHPSMFYALIKSLGPVVHIPQLLLEAYKYELNRKLEFNPDKLDQLPHSIIISGEHRISVEVHH